MKRLVPILAVILCAAPLAAGAAGFPFKGLLTIELSYEGNPLSGVDVGICLVADAEEVGGRAVYTLADGFQSSGVDVSRELTAGENAALSAILKTYASERQIEWTFRRTDEDGLASFPELKAGLYLVAQHRTHAGPYDMTSFLVAVPYPDETGWNYLITASPKTEPTPRPIRPPPPNRPNLQSNGDNYIELDGNNTPLAQWSYDEDGNIWISDELPPLAQLPQTGLLRWPITVLSASGIMLIVFGRAVSRKGKSNER